MADRPCLVVVELEVPDVRHRRTFPERLAADDAARHISLRLVGHPCGRHEVLHGPLSGLHEACGNSRSLVPLRGRDRHQRPVGLLMGCRLVGQHRMRRLIGVGPFRMPVYLPLGDDEGGLCSQRDLLCLAGAPVVVHARRIHQVIDHALAHDLAIQVQHVPLAPDDGDVLVRKLVVAD